MQNGFPAKTETSSYNLKDNLSLPQGWTSILNRKAEAHSTPLQSPKNTAISEAAMEENLIFHSGGRYLWNQSINSLALVPAWQIPFQGLNTETHNACHVSY